MKLSKSRAGLLSGAAALALAASGAIAQTQNIQRVPNVRIWGDTYTTTTQTFNSTTPTAVTGETTVNTTAYDPGIITYGSVGTNGASSQYVPDHLHIWWSADTAKATGTTGSCAIYLNGTVIARSLRTDASSGGEGTISGFVDLSYTGTTAPADPFNVGTPKQVQTVALYCWSADTSVFSVYRSQVHVDEFF